MITPVLDPDDVTHVLQRYQQRIAEHGHLVRHRRVAGIDHQRHRGRQQADRHITLVRQVAAHQRIG